MRQVAAAGEQIVPIINEASVDAARLTGFAAFGFVLLGIVFSALLAETRPHGLDAAEG